MVVAKATIVAITTTKNGRVSRTDLSLDPNDETLDGLRAYLRPMINDYVKRRVLPLLVSDGIFAVTTHVKIRETKTGQTVEIEGVGCEQG